ncbi:hypothetical protein ACFT2C_02440 [Promicromonospora sp. NPDC057138]|uniref:hypothetical protein n=1 Tax=Promicromonospora sp. NPDC057138 TaxID=3346031 RepID=UPI003632D9E6
MTQTRPMMQSRSAAAGAVAVVTAYAVAHHYLQVQWVIDAPVPVVWWVLGAILGVLGMPLLLTALGREVDGQTGDQPWGRLLLRWVLPLLVAHVAWLGLTIAVLRRFNPGLTWVPARDVAEIVPLVLLPPPELSLLWSLALLPVVARLTRRVPTGVVVVVLVALTLLTTAPTFLVFLLVGMRFGPAIDRMAETASWRSLWPYGAVALVGAAALAVPRFPDGLGVAVAGLAVLPFALLLVAKLGGRRPVSRGLARVGAAAVATYLIQIPFLALFDRVVLERLGHEGPGLQYPAAVVEPLVIAAAVVACGVVATALVRLVVGRRRPRSAGRTPQAMDRSPVLAEVDR